MKQLNQLKNRLTIINASPSFLTKMGQFLSSKGFRMYLALVLLILAAYAINSASSDISFTHVDGPIVLSDKKHQAQHAGPDFVPGSVRIDQIYSKGTHHVRFALEQISSSAKTFVGIIESSSQQPISSLQGWWIGDNEVTTQNSEEYRISQIVRR